MFYVTHKTSENTSLAGRTVTQIFANEDRDTLAFVLSDGSHLTLSAIGDCCSTSWFENFTFTSLPALVLSEEDGEYREDATVENSRYHDDKIDVSIIKFVTSTGFWDLELRNASNGYYSGWVERSTDLLSAEELAGLELLTDSF